MNTVSKYSNYEIQEAKLHTEGGDENTVDYILYAKYIDDYGKVQADYLYASWAKEDVIKIYERITGVKYI